MDEKLEADLHKPEEPPQLFLVPVQLQFNEKAWHDTIDDKLKEQLKSGHFRLIWFGTEEKHGIGAMILADDTAPHHADVYQGLIHLGKLLEEAVRLISRRARAVGQL